MKKPAIFELEIVRKNEFYVSEHMRKSFNFFACEIKRLENKTIEMTQKEKLFDVFAKVRIRNDEENQ